jgi:hypothetical protein
MIVLMTIMIWEVWSTHSSLVVIKCSRLEYIRTARHQETESLCQQHFPIFALLPVFFLLFVLPRPVLSAATWPNWSFISCCLKNSNRVLIKEHERNMKPSFFAPRSLKFTYITLNLLHTTSPLQRRIGKYWMMEKTLFIHRIIRNTKIHCVWKKICISMLKHGIALRA